MRGKETKHLRAFRSDKLNPNEHVIGFLEGWTGKIMGTGDETQRHGQFILTNDRACFYRKGILGEVLETIPLAKITSVETLSRIGFRVLRLHTSHDELAFKTFESKQMFEQVYDQLEASRHSDVQAPPSASAAVVRDECECPHCAELILVKAKICKHCGRDVVAVSRAPEDEPIAATSSFIYVACQCGAQLKAKLRLAGLSVRCPKCHSLLRVPHV